MCISCAGKVYLPESGWIRSAGELNWTTKSRGKSKRPIYGCLHRSVEKSAASLGSEISLKSACRRQPGSFMSEDETGVGVTIPLFSQIGDIPFDLSD